MLQVLQRLWLTAQRRRLGVLLLGMALGLVVAVPAGASDDAIETFIDREMEAAGLPGVAWAVVNDGEVVQAGARGVIEIGDDDRVSPETPFSSGSITKSMTALAVMQLVEAGEVGLDDAITAHLPAFAGGPASEVTVRQLLGHTSGFSTRQGNASPPELAAGDDELERLVDALSTTAPELEIGSRFSYSNANYLVLGRLVEVVSGQDYQSYVTAQILDPIGMDDSFVADGEVHEGMATGHTPWFLTRRPLREDRPGYGMAPAGGVVASARDLARYLAVMMNGEDDVLSAAGKAEMMRPASAASPFYGFGWYLDEDNASVWHAGATPGVETLATMVPAHQRGVVVLVNAGSGIGFGETSQLRNGVTAMALGRDYTGEGSRTAQQALFLGLVALPVLYLLSVAWAWLHRAEIRAKSGIAGRFSLWFPLLTTLIAAWVMTILVPGLIGSPLATIRVFQPDFALALTAGAVLGVAWALLRLVIAHTGSAVDGPRESHTPA